MVEAWHGWVLHMASKQQNTAQTVQRACFINTFQNIDISFVRILPVAPLGEAVAAAVARVTVAGRGAFARGAPHGGDHLPHCGTMCECGSGCTLLARTIVAPGCRGMTWGTWDGAHSSWKGGMSSMKRAY